MLGIYGGNGGSKCAMASVPSRGGGVAPTSWNGGSKCAMASVPSRGGGVVSTLWFPPIPATCETALNFGVSWPP